MPRSASTGGLRTGRTSAYSYSNATPLSHELCSAFLIGTECELPKDFISFTRLLLLSQSDWEKTQEKDKVPKAMLDTDVISVAIDVLGQRLSEYPTTIEVCSVSLN